MLKHAIGVLVAGHTTLALHRVAHVGKDVHARGVHPHKKRLVGLGLLFDELLRGRGGFVVDGFHALGGQGPGVFNLAVGKTVDYATGRGGLDESRVILGPVRAFGFFLGIEVVEVAEKLVKTMIGRQVLVAVAQVVFTELCSGVALGFERLGDGDIALLQAYRCSRYADFGQACAQRRLPGDKRRAPGGAAVLCVVVSEHHAFFGNPVDVGGFVAHHTHGVGADIGLANVITKDHQDIGFFGGHGGGGQRHHRSRHEG